MDVKTYEDYMEALKDLEDGRWGRIENELVTKWNQLKY